MLMEHIENSCEVMLAAGAAEHEPAVHVVCVIYMRQTRYLAQNLSGQLKYLYGYGLPCP